MNGKFTMPTNTDKKYYAFISYKREDEEWAKWLQNKLEHYKLPSNLNGSSDLPKEIRPIFRDQSDLAGGVLAEEINKALENSQYLIVICSPKSAQSEWVGKEVQTFIEMGRTDKIIPFIVGGEPHSENLEEECFPLSLKNLPKEQELLGVNINEMGRDAAAVKVVARMFGLRFDELWQRHEREKKHRRNWIITASVAAFLVMFGIAGWIWHQNVMLKQQRWEMLENQSRFVSKEVIANAKTDSYLARRVALEILPQNVSNTIDRPYTVEAERALRKACDYNYAILRGRMGSITLVKFSHDGKRILSLSEGFAVKIWDVESGAEIMTLMDDVVTADFSPDGKQIMTASDGAISMWSAETGDKLWTVNNDSINYTVKFTPDGKNVVHVNDTTIQIINIETTDLLTVPIENKGQCYVFDISPDGNYLACVSTVYQTDDADNQIFKENNIRVFDIVTGEEILLFNGHEQLIYSIVYSPDGKKIVTISVDMDISAWDAITGSKLKDMKSDLNSYTNQAVFSPDGTRLYTCNDNGFVIVWDVLSGNEIKRWKAYSYVVNAVAISHDGRTIASSSDDSMVKMWNVDAEDANVVERMTFDNHTSYHNWLISPDGKIFVADNDNELIIINRNNSKRFVYDNYGYVNRGLHGDLLNNKYLKVAADNGIIVIIDVETGKEMMHVDYYNYEESHFAIDNQIINIKHNIENYIDSIKIKNIETGEVIKQIELDYYGWINSAEFSPDNKRMVITQSYSVIILDIKTGEKIMKLRDHTARVEFAKYTPDGKLIVSADITGVTDVWDAETGELIARFGDNNGYFYFSQDGKYILSKSQENLFNVVDIERGSCVYSIESPIDTLDAAVFVNNDTQIMTVSTDGTIRIWDFPPLQDLIDQTRERFKNRPLTEEERKMYYLE